MNIIVGMSGGVDSSVAAYLLQQQGHQVQGVFMKNWQADDDDETCTAALDLTDAQAVCARLNIPLHSVNFSHEYWDNVFNHFLDEYRAGRTPNPDILCNKEIKFKAFLDHAMKLGADAIATGHYVRRQQHNNHYQLVTAVDDNKDQSYFLYTLNQQQLAKSLFPLGELTKPEVRRIAAEQGFPNHQKKDSTGICFIGERKFKEFLQQYLLTQPGAIEDTAGNSIGKHDGLMYYTNGQRQGLNIGGLSDALEAPWYVVDKDIPRNVLIVAQGNDHPRLFAKQLNCCDLHWISGEVPEKTFQAQAKIRYRQQSQACSVTLTPDGAQVSFKEKQRAVTPGQAIVFYQDTVCLGGGTIVS